MSSTTSNVSPGKDTYWWQGSVMDVKARAQEAGGALVAPVPVTPLPFRTSPSLTCPQH